MSDILRAAAWTELVEAADGRKAQGDGLVQKARDTALSAAAKEWARASGWREPRAETTTGGDVPVLPFGRAKGTPITEATVKDLEWTAGALGRSIDDETKARWREDNVRLRDAIMAEVERR
jgi:hypothetical protein